MPSPLISLSFSMDKINAPLSCYLSRPVECSCLFGQKFSKDREIFRQLERRFVQIMERVSFMPELHTNDFTVVYQPFFKDASVFYQNDVKADVSIMAIDCVHLSQKGHAVSANGKIYSESFLAFHLALLLFQRCVEQHDGACWTEKHGLESSFREIQLPNTSESLHLHKLQQLSSNFPMLSSRLNSVVFTVILSSIVSSPQQYFQLFLTKSFDLKERCATS